MERYLPSPESLAKLKKSELIDLILELRQQTQEHESAILLPGDGSGTELNFGVGFKTLFENASHGMVITNTDGQILEANEAFAALNGFSRSELLGKSVVDLTHPDDRDELRSFAKKVGSGETRRAQVEKRILTKSGASRWAEVTRHVIEDSGSGIKYVVTEVRDIDHLKSADALIDRQQTIFEAVFQGVPDAMVMVDADRNVILSNPAFTKIFGYPPEEIQNRSTSILYRNRADFERLGKLKYNADAADDLLPYEVQYRRKDGKTFLGETVGAGIRSPEGHTIGFIGVVRDVTTHKEEQNQLIQSEKRFRDYASAAADRFWETDAQFRFTYNSPASDIFILSSDRLKGLIRWEMPEFDADPQELERHKQRLAARKPFRDFRYTITGEDGRIFYRRSSGVPVYDEKGIFTGYRGVNIDETPTREAQLRAATLRERLIVAMDSIDVGVVLWSADRKFVDANDFGRKMMGQAEIYLVPGISHEDFVRLRSSYIACGSDEDRRQWALDRVAEWDSPTSQHESQFEDGSWYRVYKHRLPEGDMIALHTDVTGVKEREEALNAARLEAEFASRAKSEFLSLVSHELRTPLNAILGFAQLFERTPETLELDKLARFGRLIRENGTHLLEIINGILDLSAVEAGKVQLTEEDFNLFDAVENTVSMVRFRADSEGILIILPRSLPRAKIRADRVKFKQILINLLINAIKFSPMGSTVRIEMKDLKPHGFSVGIRDTGVGMTPAEIEKALTMFGRVSAKDGKRATEGSGLGLPIAQGLIEAHGGDLSVESAPGLGTTVTVRLPEDRIVSRT